MGIRIATRGSLIVTFAALTATACDGPKASTTGPADPGPSFATATVITEMRGTGAIGDGTPTFYGLNRQWFDLDVGISGGVASGTLEYYDSAFVKQDGHYPHFVVGPAYPGTAIASFVQTSATCVEFEGVGYLINTGEMLAFRAQTCDNGQPGAGLDTFGIEVPQRLLTNGNIYYAGPAFLAYGELTLSGTATPAPSLP